MTTLSPLSLSQECSHDTISSFIQQTIIEYQSYMGTQRSEARESVAIPVSVSPLNSQLQRDGDTFFAVTRDVSCSGIGLFHTARVDAEWLEIELSTPATGQRLKLLANVQHCTPCGSFYLIGCRFGSTDD